jgi:hypothetical protein
MSEMEIERTQTGVRLATPLLKVLRALADYKDMSLGDLIEGIVLHAFDNKTPFSKETLRAIAQLRTVYGLELTSADAHAIKESKPKDGK